MIANLRPTSDAEIDRLLAHPAEITRFLSGGGAADGVERVGLNKAWHAIHFVLTGSRLGGEEPRHATVEASTEEVASSRIKIRGSARNARAIATRWRCPPESVRPRSPTSVS